MSTKVLYACIMAAVAVVCSYLGGVALGFLCTFSILIAYLEWYAISFLAHEQSKTVPKILGYACLTILPYTVFTLKRHEVLLQVFSIVWCTDIGALLGGKIGGGPKLWPAISPNKTIIGLLCGIMCGVYISKLFFQSWAFSLSETFILASFAQIGDLAESACKRQAGIKDSNLPDLAIPGHGGILDRLDAMIFTFPIACVFIGLHS